MKATIVIPKSVATSPPAADGGEGIGPTPDSSLRSQWQTNKSVQPIKTNCVSQPKCLEYLWDLADHSRFRLSARHTPRQPTLMATMEALAYSETALVFVLICSCPHLDEVLA